MFKKKKLAEKEFFISIGAGLNQIPLIREARKLGYHVIGIDRNTSAPGLLGCDLKIQESIHDRKIIYQKLNEILFSGEISGIMTRSYGAAIKTTAYLNEKFNISYIPLMQCDNFIDKKLMKDAFRAGGIPSAEVVKLPARNRIEKFSHLFPIISKPVTGHAKAGVLLYKNPEELKKEWPSPAQKKKIIFERFITGDEVIVAGLVHNKTFYLVDITDKKTSDDLSFVDIMHISPSRYFERHKEFIDIGQNIADTFQLHSTPLIIEAIIETDGKIMVIEAVPEFGGEFLSDIAIPARTGYNFISQAIRSMTGLRFKLPPLKKPKKAVVVRYITGNGGKLVSCSPEKPRNLKGVIFSRVFKGIGASIQTARTNHDRIGVVITKGKTVDEAIATAEKAVELFHIKIKD